MSVLSFADLLQPLPGSPADFGTANHAVAWRVARQATHTIYYWQDFQGDVRRLTGSFQNTPEIQNQSSVILYASDSYHFSVAFTALVLMRKEILLPHSGSAGAIAELCIERCCAVVDANVHHSLTTGGCDLPAINLEEALTNSNPMNELPVCSFTDSCSVGVVVFTSGSSGGPKAIRKKLGHFLEEVIALESLWGDSIRDAGFVSTVSHQHVYGLLFRLLWPLLSRRAFCANAFQYPEEFLRQLNTGEPQVLVSSPAFLSRLPGHVSNRSVATKGQLIKLFSSGGPLKPEHNFAVKLLLNTVITEVFGSSETGGVGFRERTCAGDSVAWTTLPGVQIKTATESGQLLVKSPYVFTSDWYAMGDVATLLDKHQFVIKGRADRVVKIEEKRVSLDDIEQRLMQTDWVCSCRVILLQGKRTEAGAALVLNEQGKQLLQNSGKLALTRQLRQELARFLDSVVLPRKWRIVDELPVNPQGKITLSALQDLFANQNT